MAERRAVTTAPHDALTQQSWMRAVVQWSLRTGRLPAPTLTRADWMYITSVFALTRVAIFVLGVIGSAMFPSVVGLHTWSLQPISLLSSGSWLRVYNQFDSGWYLGISHHYLVPSSGDPDWLREWAFFPLYPIVLHGASVALQVLHVPGDVDRIAGVLVSHAALFVAIIYLYRLVRAELSGAAAQRTVTYLLIFPTSLFLSAIYPEGLFLLTSVGAFYAARRRYWAVAGILAAAALLTRVQGLVLLVPLGLEFVAAWRAEGRRSVAGLLRAGWLALPFVALGGYALYSHAQTGYWLAFVQAGHVWGRRVTPPIYPLIRYALAPSLGGAFTFDFGAANFASAIVFLVAGVIAARRLPPIYAVWIWLGVLVPLSSGGHQLTSLTRYLVTDFPAFIAIAAWALGVRWSPTGTTHDKISATTLDLRDRVVVIPSLLLLALYVVMFTNGVWAAV